VTAVAVFGTNDEKIHVSARSKDIRVNIGAVMSQAFSDIGSAGGHANAGAAQIPLASLRASATARRFYTSSKRL